MDTQLFRGTTLAALLICGSLSASASSAEIVSGQDKEGTSMKWQSAELDSQSRRPAYLGDQGAQGELRYANLHLVRGGGR